MARRTGIAGRLAAERLTRLPQPLGLAAGVLALGLGLMLMAGTLARSFEESMLDFIRHQVRADVVVASTATTGWIEAPLPAALTGPITALSGVARVERIRLAEHRLRGERISIDSLDASAFAPERADDFVFHAGAPATALAAVAAGRAALVSRNFARNFSTDVGDAVTLDTPSGPLTLPVAGVVVDYVSPRGSVIVSRDCYVRHWGDDTVTRFHVWLAPGASVKDLRAALASDVGAAHGLKVLTQRELYAYHQDAVRRAFRFTDALETLPLLVAALGLAEALLATVLDRRRELACLRAGGATRRQVMASVIAESVGVGALGYAGGIAMGAVLALLWVRLNFAVQLGWDLDFHFAWASLPIAAAAALAVTIPAAVLPARRAVSLPIVAALRDE
jgi:putative ABC transport system permease protein